MRKILISFAIAVATVFASVEVCEKTCGDGFGGCYSTTGNYKSCLKSKASCSLDCFKGLQVKSHFKVKADVGVCQKTCVLDWGKCVLSTFNMQDCTKQETTCALDCLKGVQP